MKTCPVVLNYNNESSEGVFDMKSKRFLVARTDIHALDQMGFVYFDDGDEGYCENDNGYYCSGLIKTIPYTNIKNIKPEVYDGEKFHYYTPVDNNGSNPFVISNGSLIILCKEDEFCDYIEHMKTGAESSISLRLTYFDMAGEKRTLYANLIDDHEFMHNMDIDIGVFLNLKVPRSFYNMETPSYILDVTGEFEVRVGVVALYDQVTDDIRYFIVEHGFLSQEIYDPMECSLFGDWVVENHTDERVTCHRQVGNVTHMVMYDADFDLVYSDVCLTSDFEDFDLEDLFNDCINNEAEKVNEPFECENYESECDGDCKNCTIEEDFENEYEYFNSGTEDFRKLDLY